MTPQDSVGRTEPRTEREIDYGARLIRALRAMDIEVPAEDEIEAGVAAMDLETLRLDWMREGYETREERP